MNKLKSNEEYFEFSKLLVVIPTQEIKNLLINNNIRLPFYVHNFLLKETLRSKVFDKSIYKDFTDEQKFRLRGYDKYSIYPLEKLMDRYNIEFDLARYKELLFDFVFANMEKLGLKHEFAKELDKLKEIYPVDLEELIYSEFYYTIKDLFFVENGFLDGKLISEYDEDTIASYTLGDLKGLGAKYDIKIPRRINKAKLLEILQAKFKMSDDELELIKSNSVLDLEIYAREKGFKISIDLKKRDMIEFIEFSLGMYHKPIGIDTYSYDIPLESPEEATLADLNIEEEPEELMEEDVDTTPIPVEEDVVEPMIVAEEEQIVEEETVETTEEQESPVEDSEGEQPVEKPVEEEPVEESVEEQASEEIPIVEIPVEEETVEEESVEVFEAEPIEEVYEEDEIEPTPYTEPEPIVEEEEEPRKEVPEPKPIDPEPRPEDLSPAKFLQEDKNQPSDSLLSNEEKDLLDEKINQIIKKYYKKRRIKRIVWISIITVAILIIALAVYSFIYLQNNGVLPFGL